MREPPRAGNQVHSWIGLLEAPFQPGRAGSDTQRVSKPTPYGPGASEPHSGAGASAGGTTVAQALARTSSNGSSRFQSMAAG